MLSLLTMAMLSACQLSPLSDSQAHTGDNKASVETQAQKNNNRMQKRLSSHLWQLTAFFGQNIPTTGNTNLRFSSRNTNVSGSAGCNRYFGSYTLHQNKLSFSQLASTKMMCMDMTEENAFFKHISQVNRFKLHDHVLTLFDKGMPLMQFTAQSLPKDNK